MCVPSATDASLTQMALSHCARVVAVDAGVDVAAFGVRVAVAAAAGTGVSVGAWVGWAAAVWVMLAITVWTTDVCKALTSTCVEVGVAGPRLAQALSRVEINKIEIKLVSFIVAPFLGGN